VCGDAFRYSRERKASSLFFFFYFFPLLGKKKEKMFLVWFCFGVASGPGGLNWDSQTGKLKWVFPLLYFFFGFEVDLGIKLKPNGMK